MHTELFQTEKPMVVCGLDEAGRGPLAGPVYAACVILSADFPIEILQDSKKMSEKKRDSAAIIIFEKALAYGIGWANATEIDEINILQASLLAMKRAYEAMPMKADFAYVDGLYTPEIATAKKAVPKADSIFPEVMAASILAKTARDRIMYIWDAIYPEYGYAKHKGYPTQAHRDICKKIGPSPIQRLSFTYK